MCDGIIKITLVVCDRIVYDKLTSCVVNRVLIGGNPEMIHSVWWSVVVCGGLWWSVVVCDGLCVEGWCCLMNGSQSGRMWTIPSLHRTHASFGVFLLILLMYL